jgi:hypothetical protein
VKQLLDNIVWHALSGPHARFSAGDNKEAVVRVVSRG